MAKQPKRRVDPDNARIAATLTRREWKALLAVLEASVTIMTEQMHQVMFARLHADLVRQTGVQTEPIVLEEEDPDE
jgi:hypothetical protein